MRVFSLLLLVVATTIVASTSAESESKQHRDITSPTTLQWRTITENEAPVKRNLRKKASEEERTLTSAVSMFDDLLKAKGLQVIPYAQLGDLEPKVRTAYLKVLVELERQKIIEITGKVPKMIQNRPNKLGRLAQYNRWIFKNKEPEYVLEKYPAFFKSYEEFFNNRMTRGYKYA
ncbi:hypothetical protein P3T76_001470 [Phytophthora citrophthora]|uniref:RxLR effector protein n=1 Tax=Phytophthora citrophthora TaxID=4793 RepID=A0AAD9GZX9_9STRA|nr:hypothetical protein P3T76_001470 [Phytophthora citrophthora]